MNPVMQMDPLKNEKKPENPKPKRVEVVPPDPAWQARFQEAREHLLSILPGRDVRVEHVGSTSVPDLAAKPILDIDLVLRNAADFEQVKALLEAYGYHHVGDLGISGREAFKYNDKPQFMPHNLYVLSADSDELKRHLTFRDWLRSHPEDRELYAQAKIAAAHRFPQDISAYIDAKSDVILDIYARCGLYGPQDLLELTRSVLINRYDLPVDQIACNSLQPGISLCQAHTGRGVFFLLVREQVGSARSAILLDKSIASGADGLPIATLSGQRVCSTPFAIFALFRSRQEALDFLDSQSWKEATDPEEKNG